ncbi:inactive ubiquitin carboxyl-terminal hydrolase MINDY-4B-like isoform X2 [Homarus americanus]|uniref:inactive ubiquitin carboxyl-terminal hydrolase MINDY-4B-like isoform X2 n=1 Tax=Homarus americanus TaxID=6706 RepID=UPI001C463057|nr:inactive ubiquitin carboxyl-terminal hydrolase MINDY-4B-like isoform X2 [Homarus americanus]
MAAFGGFQDAVKRVIHTQSSFTAFNQKSKRVLYPTKPKSSVQKVPVLGGTPITADTALALRRQVFGSADLLGSTENEWLGQSFVFHDGETVEAYSLKMHKTSTKGLAMCVQGFILKHLLFNRRGARVVADPTVLLRATTKAQEEALVGALSDILWRAGERQHAVLCLAQENIYVNDTPSYQSDGCTERIHTFEFKKQDELTFNLKKYLFEFLADEGNGLLLFLYSLVLSRGFNKLNEDMGGEEVSLLCTNAIIHPCLATLMLTGRATLFLHNGIIYEGSEDTMAKPKTGIITRAEVGLLVWRRPEEGGQVNVGSRLKTPSFPVWVTRCNDSYGILFNPNKELTRDYHAENRFDLYYYSASTNQKSATIITIDTRNQTVKEEYNSPYLENLIHTKWQGADVNWNGTAPFV